MTYWKKPRKNLVLERGVKHALSDSEFVKLIVCPGAATAIDSDRIEAPIAQPPTMDSERVSQHDECVD